MRNFSNEVCWKGKSPGFERETFKGELKDKSVSNQHSIPMNSIGKSVGRVVFSSSFPRLPPPQNFLPRWSFFFRAKGSCEKISQFGPSTDTLFHLSHATHNIYVLTETYFHSLARPASWKRVGARRGEENSQAFSFFRRQCVPELFQSKPNIPDTQSSATIASLQLRYLSTAFRRELRIFSSHENFTCVTSFRAPRIIHAHICPHIDTFTPR